MANLPPRAREPRPIRYRVQLVLLVDDSTGERVARLVRATKLSMAEIGRQALADALPGLESYYHEELAIYDGVAPKVRKKARRAGATVETAADPAA